jgi:hypothetical protein
LTGTSRERKPGRERLARRSTVDGFPTSHRPLPGWQPSYYCLRDIYSWKNRTFLHRPVYAGDEDLLYRGKPAAVETAVKAVIGASESPGRCRVVAISARCPPSAEYLFPLAQLVSRAFPLSFTLYPYPSMDRHPDFESLNVLLSDGRPLTYKSISKLSI